MKTDTDKGDKGHRACPSNPDLSMTCPAESWVQLWDPWDLQNLLEGVCKASQAILSFNQPWTSGLLIPCTGMSLDYFFLFMEESCEKPSGDRKEAVLEVRLVKGILWINEFRTLHLLQPQISKLGTAKTETWCVQASPTMKEFSASCSYYKLLQPLHFYLTVYKLILW